jgi:hypothetical protein
VRAGDVVRATWGFDGERDDDVATLAFHMPPE